MGKLRVPPMKKYGFLLLIVFLLVFSSAFAHDHIDSGEGEVVYNSYVAPTENQDGSTGPGTCSACGAVVVPASRIPKLSEQRQASQPSAPSDAGSSNASEPQDSGASASGGQSSGSADTGSSGSGSSSSAFQDSGSSGSGSGTAGVSSDSPGAQPPSSGPAADVPGQSSGTPAQAATEAPLIVMSPEPIPAPTAVPTPVQPITPDSHPSAGQPTAQPDLREAEQKKNNAAPAGGASEKNDASGEKGSSGGSARSGGRDLKVWPVFSTRFPWRRLRMNPEAGIQIRIAGMLLWPQPEAVSPLMNLIQQPSGNPDP